MKFPHFIVAGAAKAGTSSLCDYLGQHPQLFMTQPKELNFFNNQRKPEDLTNYHSYFNKATGKIAGEGSVSYLHYSEIAAPQLKAFFPEVKLIFMLRNPVDRYFSDFWFNVSRGTVVYRKNLFDDILFKRRTMSDPGNKTRDYRGLLIEKGLYSKHLKSYLRHFHNSQIHLVFFEDFIADTKKELAKVYHFLGVDSEFEKIFLEVKNKTKYPGRLGWAYSTWKHVKEFLPVGFIVRHRKKFIRVKELFFTDTKPTISDNARLELRNIYLESIQELEELTGRDLTNWKA